MTTPITEVSLTDLLIEAASTFKLEDEFIEGRSSVKATTEKRWTLANAVTLAQDMVNRAEARTNAKPEHWKEAQGELTRLRRELWETEGEILMLRAELERRVRRVRTGGAT